jgi:hypothetical protein
MKWLTRDWARGQLGELEAEAAEDNYRAQLALLAASTEGSVAAMALADNTRYDLSDGLVDTIEWNRDTGLLNVSIVQGSLQTGYGQLQIAARNASVEVQECSLPEVVSNPKSEVWYWELDRSEVSSSQYEIRLLMWPMGEIDLSFEQLDLTWTARPDRDQPPLRRIVDIR